MKTIIFDYSGVINDNRETTYQTVVKIFEHFKGPTISYEEFRRNWIQPFMLFYNKYLPDVSFEEEVIVYKKVYQEVITEHPVKLYPGIADFLKKLFVQGKDLIIVSSDAEKYIRQELQAFELDKIFKHLVAGVHDKTESVIKLVASDNLDFAKTIFIGDTVHEIEAGKKAGILTGAVTWGIDTEDKLLAAKPDFLFHDLSELQRIFN
ncbi:MAG: HAD family hydrolase [Patescibacteria group bacterium]|jgi:HAD superfamily hydrolase (TIGR01549 family)